MKLQLIDACDQCKHCRYSAFRPCGHRCYCDLDPEKDLTIDPETNVQEWCRLPDAQEAT